MRTRRCSLLALVAVGACLTTAAVPERAVLLRNRGFAELENEQPAKAEEAFRELTRVLPEEPLGWADLAIALLRQQKFAEAEAAITRGLELAPGDPELLAIHAEVLQWSGKPDEAVALYRRAAAAAPDDVQLQYALYRQASTTGSEEDLGAALERLARLRPDNLVVVLQRGLRAIRGDDRATASSAFLRVRELIWQAPDAAVGLLDQLLEALAAGDVAAARLPAQRLDNVLKITPMFRQSLRELDLGIQGRPLFALRDEPQPESFGTPVEVSFRGQRVAETAGAAIVSADFNGDQTPDLAWLSAGAAPRIEVRLAGAEPQRLEAPGMARLRAADLDNDGHLDLLGWGPSAVRFWRGGADGRLAEATGELGLAGAGATAAAVLDFDIEGDLDLLLAGGASRGPELYRNSLSGPLEAVGERSLPALELAGVRDVVASDLDRDGDLDLLIAHDGGLSWLDNLRQGRFAVRRGGFEKATATRIASADFDNDGWPDVVAADGGLAFFRNAEGSFEPWPLAGSLRSTAEWTALAAFDADNDGRLDLALGGPRAFAVMRQRPRGGFEFLALEGAPAGAAALAAADLDRDGDLDLAVAGPDGLHRLENRGGNANHWLSVRLRGLDKGNSKNNVFGYGSTAEVRAGRAYQFREADSDVIHFGLGRRPTAELLRVVWTNGVPQNRLDPGADQWIVEEQLLKGSCPFLYAWDGERVRFVTDLLWGSPAGLPVAPGVWAGADPRELVLVEGAAPVDGVYRLFLTEELWEAAFFDLARLWVVDHPADVEVASSLKVLFGREVPETVHGTRGLRPLAAALDAAGRDVTDRVARRDDVYADGWRASRYQGVAAEPWALTLDLGAAPAAPVRLHLDGWIFPADASLNLAVAQRADLPPVPARLEVETAAGWTELLDPMGFPAGKTKTMVVDTPPLPEGARRLRIVSNQWLSWDRIAWSTAPADDAPRVRARLLPSRAELRFRGFSALVRSAPNAPHAFDYARVTTESPWLPFPGRYTRYGDVRELLAEVDDRLLILGPGDETALEFDASELGESAPGWRRAVFLESFGWDKDADRNTWEAKQVEPLPFSGMSGYPWGPDESYPDTPRHRRYRAEWLTRAVGPEPVGPSR